MTGTQQDLGVFGDDVRNLLDRWARAHLLTDEQVELILRAEHLDVGPAPHTVTPATGHVTVTPPRAAGSRLVVEALAYLGGALALAAALLLVQMWWHDMSTGARLAVPLSAAASLLLAGLLVPGDAPERGRLRSVLWLTATASWAAAVAVLGDQVFDLDPPDTTLLVGLAAVAMSWPLYLRSRTALQQLALFVSLAASAGAVGARAGWDEPTLVGSGVWLVAVAWAVLAVRHVVRPEREVGVTAAVGLIVGALMMQGALGGQAVALLTVLGLYTWGVRADSLALLGVSSLATLLLVPSSVSYFFPDGGRVVVPLVLLAVGAVLVSTAVLVTRRRGQRSAADRPGG